MPKLTPDNPLFLTTALSIVVAGCGSESQQPPVDNGWDNASVQTPAPSQEMSISDYVERYKDGLAEPEQMEIVANEKGEKFLLLEFPTDTTQPGQTEPTQKFYKQLDGQQTIAADSVDSRNMRGSGSHVYFYRWYPYYTGGYYSPHSSYHGYYTDINHAPHTSAERSSNHRGNLASRYNSIRMQASHHHTTVSFRHNLPVSRTGSHRGSFGRTASHHSHHSGVHPHVGG